MTAFDVLSRDLDIYKSTFLEASAGTGKTFSIENLVVRFLIEHQSGQEPLTLSQMLIVTFTKAATFELKMRIYLHLQKILTICKADHLKEAEPFDYLKPFAEDTQKLKEAVHRLERAIAEFDDAQIFTIHGFCYRMLSLFGLEAKVSFGINAPEMSPLTPILNDIVADFFQYGWNDKKYTLSQLQILLDHFDRDGEALQKEVVRSLTLQFLVDSPLVSLEEKIKTLNLVIQTFQLSSDKEASLQAFKQHASQYKGVCTQKGEVKELFMRQASLLVDFIENKEISFIELDDFLNGAYLFFTSFQKENMTVRAQKLETKKEDLFWQEVIIRISPMIIPMVDPISILASVIADCRALSEIRLGQEERWTHEGLLQIMNQSLENKAFAEQIFQKYQAVIIDEFQDTDPQQWEIFSKCFFSAGDSKLCYLVGDPKQSIYAFRKADIYTYLCAASQLPFLQKASLDTNFRSQPLLIEALNILFAEKAVGWMALPRLKQFLAVPSVKIPPGKNPQLGSHGLGAIHFFIAEGESKTTKWPSIEMEERCFFTFIASEIRRCQELLGIECDQFAVLVKDRFQAQRLKEALKKWQIPSLTRRHRSLLESKVIKAMSDLLSALEYPGRASKVRQVLAGLFFQWNDQQLLTLNDSDTEREVIEQFCKWRLSLIEKGIASFYQSFIDTAPLWDDRSVASRFLSQEEGKGLYLELSLIFDFLLQQESQNGRSIVFLIKALKSLEKEDPESEAFKIPMDLEEKAVQILTMHMSKGLEFTVVFALGLVMRTPLRFSLEEQLQGDCTALNEEKDAEKMRQLYVAMTRAKEKLYVPIAIDTKNRALAPGLASPIELFLASLDYKAESISDLYAHFKSKGEIITILDELKEKTSISYSIITPTLKMENEEQKMSLPNLYPPPPIALSFKKQVALSYTALVSHTQQEEEEDLLPRPSQEGLIIPAGAETGVLMHTLLQKLPYSLIKQELNPQKLVPFCTSYLKGTILKEKIPQVAIWLYQVVTHPYCLGDQILRMIDIKEEDKLQEMEFSYPCTKGMMTGVVDLFFQWQGLYYILDWKTNHLSDYSIKDLKEEMSKSNYFLQASIYRAAIEKYLSRFETRTFDECFGGALYLFLRGIEHPQTQGLYFFKPTPLIL